MRAAEGQRRFHAGNDPLPGAGEAGTAGLSQPYREVRQRTAGLIERASREEWRLQPAAFVSPPWWTLGHTSWFFAKNVLEPRGRWLREDRDLEYLLNSYYQVHGSRLPRPDRGKMSRPGNEEVLAYRELVDRRMESLILEAREDDAGLRSLVVLGLEHEEQHQELFLTELKYIRHQNPPHLRVPYSQAVEGRAGGGDASWIPFEEGLHEIGNLEGGFSWDNELPVHKRYLAPFALRDRLVTNAEYIEFIEDGGYGEPRLWLDGGWWKRVEEGWEAPLYWELLDGEWWQWTLGGMRLLRLDEPVAHVSFYEADAFARFTARRTDRRVRLPREDEWERAARVMEISARDSNFLETGAYHPLPSPGGAGGSQLLGDVWEWTSSHHEAYPGYRPLAGPLREYNEKFMDNARVLRGGSCASPREHIRISYRNFWAPETRFQFTGIRLAWDLA